MTQHLKMDQPDKRHRFDDMAQGVIGKAVDRPEGALKVTGGAHYANEFQPEGLCHGVLVRATIASGTVTKLHKAEIEALPGVLAVIDDNRLLRNPAQGTANEAPVQGSQTVAYFGQPIALIVAEQFEQATHAAKQLRIDYDESEAATDPSVESLDTEKPDAQQLSQGDLDQAMQSAYRSVDVHYTTPPHNSAAMEPHASIAQWHGEQLTLHGSYQMLNYNRNELADSLGMDAENVRILSPYVGGGFGSKLGIAPEAVAASIAAQQLMRPVSVVLSRPQVFEATMRRSETQQHFQLAADKTGQLIGIGHAARVSNLPDEAFSEPVTQGTHFLYAAENRRIEHEMVRVNRTCAGSVRAPGEAVGVTALENAMDELAEALNMDPVELRKRNIPTKHPETGQPFSSHKLMNALERGSELFGWSKRTAQPATQREGDWLIGLGMASAARVNILMEAKAQVTLLPDGTATVETDMTDIGTGSYAIFGQIAAELLGLPMSKVTVKLGDTALPAGAGSGGSWGASSCGSAVFLACEDIRQQLAERLGCSDQILVLKEGIAHIGEQSVAINEVLAGDTFTALGHIEPGKTSEDVQQATFGAFFAEVGVNAVTGETRVRRMLGVFAAGRILNPKTARSQCLGGMTFGIGMALTEEIVHDPRDGHIVNHDLGEYHLPVNADVPQLEVELLEELDDWTNPMQAKGIGELGICGAGAAITNAIYNATGIRVRDYPATLDKLLDGLSSHHA